MQNPVLQHSDSPFLRDALRSTSAATLRGRGAITDPGAPILLQSYVRRRAAAVLAMQAATDGLARLFRLSGPWMRALRNRGMSTVDALRPLKKLLAQPALR